MSFNTIVNKLRISLNTHCFKLHHIHVNNSNKMHRINFLALESYAKMKEITTFGNLFPGSNRSSVRNISFNNMSILHFKLSVTYNNIITMYSILTKSDD